MGAKKPHRVRRDAKLKLLPHAQRDQVREWFREDDWQSCAQRILSELHIASPKEPTKPLSRQTIYDAINFWDAQAITDEMFSFRDAQEELMKQFRPGDLRTAREFGEFSLMQRGNKTQDKDILAVAFSAQDSRARGELEVQKVAIKREQVAHSKEQLKLEREKFKASIRSKVEAGLAEIAEQVKGNAAAEAALARLLEAVKKK